MKKYLLLIFVVNCYSAHAQDYSMILDSLQNIVRNHLQQGSPDFKEVLDVYDSIAVLAKDTTEIGKGYNFRGLQKYFDGNNVGAVEDYSKALNYFEIGYDTFYIALANNNIGAAFDLRKDPTSSLIYYQKSFDKFEELSDTFWMANVKNNIAVQFTKKKLYPESNIGFGEAAKLFLALQDTMSYATAISNMSANYELLGDLISADSILTKYFDLPRQYFENETLSNSLNSKAKVKMMQGELSKALEFNEQAIAILEDNGLKIGLERKFKTKADILTKQGNYKEALNALALFHNMQDSLWDKTKDATILELRTQYDLEKKEQEIVNLNVENEIQQLKFDKVKQSRLLYGTGFLGLIMISGFLIYLVKMRNSSNQQLKSKNDIIEKSLAEKEILLKEIHHRVKNNLQVVSSLLSLQSQYIEDEAAMNAINAGQNRVSSMALIHQNLYKENNLSGVYSKDYFSALIDNLFETYNINESQIRLIKNVENLNLDVDTMIPLGLIANELITNSLKHAFANQDSGILEVALKNVDGKIILSVKDNGKGISSDAFLNSHSFGNKIISAFKRKLGAELSIENDKGTEVILEVSNFKLAS